jgi:hypothetical protein
MLHIHAREAHTPPLIYFETDAYITFLNEHNLPNLNLTVDDATRLKKSKPAHI